MIDRYLEEYLGRMNKHNRNKNERKYEKDKKPKKNLEKGGWRKRELTNQLRKGHMYRATAEEDKIRNHESQNKLFTRGMN